MELLALYHKIYTDTVLPSDYVDWAAHSLYSDTPEIKKLASMSRQVQLNPFEIEKMFADAMKSIQQEAPTKDECLEHHLKHLHSQLLIPNENALMIVKEIYNYAVAYELFDIQMNWQEISDIMDDFYYGDNLYGYTYEKINEMIIAQARSLWHSKRSKFTFSEFIGQKIIKVELKPQFLIEFEKGALIIECPWRIRDTEEILLGETDIQTNQKGENSLQELLMDKMINDVQLLEQCPFLIVQCDDIFLDVFHASSFFEGWTLTDEEDFYMFSLPGGSIA